MLRAFRDHALCAAMDHRADACGIEEVLDTGAVSVTPCPERGGVGDGVNVAGGEVVEHDHLVSGGEECVCGCGANVAGTSSDKDCCDRLCHARILALH